ncbi:MAG: ferrochelatase [Betaproteobacteria bacterium]|nr:ferrochelatase [Betaproteobacteria bacterium]NBT09750.1 ferrochelatase [Betaproteobacteria bacterium]NBU50743.1 ferrochelatase [Betaproteobacteria bacterium]NBX95248.1 ferrochelatase [Betaproteobacteria bacterium]
MTFQTEPAYRHGSPARTGVLLVNLGTPDAPTAPALRRYLAEFLSDPRVVEIPALVWKPLLHGIILQVRPAKSAAKYASIWTPQGSPLAHWTRQQASLLDGALRGRGLDIMVRPAMRYGNPSVASVLDELKASGVQRVLVLPLYPQYAAATTASAQDAVMAWSGRQRRMPEWRFVNHYHDDPGYIQALAQRVQRHWATNGRSPKLLLSFHGVPERSLHLGDPYHCECHKTARLLRQALGLAPSEVVVTFQSRFGKARWLEPYTEPTLVQLAKDGTERVDVMCPGFTSDCLETLEEIAQEAQHAFLDAGGKSFHYIPCLNDEPAWIEALASIALRHLQGWPIEADLLQSPQSQQESRIQREQALALGAKD